MNQILLLNYASLESMMCSLKDIVDCYYLTKAGTPAVNTIRGQRILTDIDTLFKAAVEAGVTATWKRS